VSSGDGPGFNLTSSRLGLGYMEESRDANRGDVEKRKKEKEGKRCQLRKPDERREETAATLVSQLFVPSPGDDCRGPAESGQTTFAREGEEGK